ncbi:MAG: hypothetical protein HYX41_07000 [Bdellovibrio sp.]|nr:hypothetical protein [Bdellovibrio sp.]
MRIGIPVLLLSLLTPTVSKASMFGEETAVLLEVVANQLTELGKLAENIGVSKEHLQMLYQINDGVQQVTRQIQALQSIVDRAQGVDPTAIRSLADINRSIEDMKAISGDIQELIFVKLLLCNQTIEQAYLQSDTAYKMGQELATTGSQLALESQTASPGRAQQITASASVAQMLASGVQLQTMAQMSQLLAMHLDLQKTEIEKDLKIHSERRAYLKAALSKQSQWSPSLGSATPKRKRGTR